MKKIVLHFFVLILLLPACSKQSNGTATVVRPKNHHRWFDRKKDKRTKRIKTVKMKN